VNNSNSEKLSFLQKALKTLLSWFRNQKPLSQTRKAIVINGLIDSAAPGTDYFTMVILSSIIATLGLIQDSPAVTIGAMLVAPLISPILGLSMASVTELNHLFRYSVKGLLEGFGLALFISTIITFFAFRLPYGSLVKIPNEVLIRTHPSLLDLGIALAGGSAGAYALAHPRLSATLPGVAISTALMPPLCTIGIGFAFFNPSIFLGALLLFLTNLAAISFSGIVTFSLMGFTPGKYDRDKHLSRNRSLIFVLLILIGLILGLFTWRSLKEARTYNNATRTVMNNLPEFLNAQLIDLSITPEKNLYNISITLRATRDLTHLEVAQIQNDLSISIGQPVVLDFVIVPIQVIRPSEKSTTTQ
jgi:uncharacterized hydrophobic protein (TIGR00271 family)